MTDLAVPPARADAPRISLPAFHALLTEQHPFSLLLGIGDADRLRHRARGAAGPRLPSAAGRHHRRPHADGAGRLAMYAAVVGATGQAHAVTASLTINFLRKSPAGAIVADARLLKVGRLSAGEVILTSEHSDEPLAHIVSTWSVPKSRTAPASASSAWDRRAPAARRLLEAEPDLALTVYDIEPSRCEEFRAPPRWRPPPAKRWPNPTPWCWPCRASARSTVRWNASATAK